MVVAAKWIAATVAATAFVCLAHAQDFEQPEGNETG